jgi:ABC-2 type transport system permease protein
VTWATARAFFKRDLLTDVSYKLSFLLNGADILLTVVAFYFASVFFGEKWPHDYASFPFMLTGIAVNGYMTTSFICFSQGINGRTQGSTLKAALASHISAGSYLTLSSVYPLCRAAVDAIVYLLAGLLCGLSVSNVNVPAAILVFVVSILAFTGVGVMSAAFTLYFKRGDPLQWTVGALSWLLGGVFFPREVLPHFLQRVGAFLPISPAADAMRAAMLRNASIPDIASQLGALLLFSAIVLPLGYLAFSYAVRHAKVSGSLDHQ